MKKSRGNRCVTAVAGVVVAGLFLTGCGVVSDLFSSDTATRDDAGEITEGTNIDILTLKVGDCLNDIADTVYEAPVVPCSDPHVYEVYAEFVAPDGDYDEDVIDALADQCYDAAYTDFVGVPWELSTLDASYLVPTPRSWRANDRAIQCMIYDTAGTVTGTLKDSAR